MPYRFVHAADIHLDSPLRSLALRDAELAELIGNATRQAFTRVIKLCLDEQVDALLLSGDLYDGDQTSMKTARFLAEQVRRLHEAGIRVFVIRGNHDALSKITKELTFPEEIKIFGGRAETVTVDRAKGAFAVAIHGISFAQPHAPDSLLPKFRPPHDDTVNIGLLHTSLAGAPGHDAYAPCSEADLHASGFRYWALGHVHKRSVATGASTIVMPGMPQGRDINEAGPKSVSLVTIADDRSIAVEEHVTSVAQFERVVVDLGGIEDWREAVGRIAGALERSRGAVASEHLVARVHLKGATPLAWRLRRDIDLMKSEADDRASVLGRCWVEKLEIDCIAPGSVPGIAGQPADPLAELRRLIAEEIVPSEQFRAEVATIADELITQLPPELRSLLGTDEPSQASALAGLSREGVEDVLAQLHSHAGTG